MTNLSGANLNNGAAVGPQGEGMDSPSGFPEYPAYKDSGVEWLGEVPEHWEVGSFRRLIKSVGNGTTADQVDEADDTVAVSRIETISTGQINFEKAGHVAPQDVAKRFLLNAGDILFSHINSLSMVGNVAIYLGGRPLLHGMNLLRIQPLSSVSSEWVLYWLKSKNIRQEVESRAKPAINQASISTDSVRALPGLIPPKVEQTQIARFLDHETARIDALIEEQQRLIELLKEKRQAVISHAVTKGLDPTVPMKDSGVEWLGEVPAHWKVSKLGHYAQILTGFPFPSASFSHDESDVRLLRGANIGVGSLKWIDTVYWNLSEGDNLSSYLMEEGQIVLGMDRPWISEGMRIARVTQEDMPCLLLQRVAAITPSAEFDDEYLFFLLASELFKTYVEPDLTGVSVPHISPEQIMSFQISVPEIGEQRRISSFIRTQLDQMSALFEQASESVELLQERRSALISAAVTGKVDVRGWQPPASAQAPELVEEAV
jgi:type I restriction enzyme S subunit